MEMYLVALVVLDGQRGTEVLDACRKIQLR
jgi:hypothetical protein